MKSITQSCCSRLEPTMDRHLYCMPPRVNCSSLPTLCLLLIVCFLHSRANGLEPPTKRPLDPAMASEVQKFEGQLKGQEKKLYDKYRTSTPLTDQQNLMIGSWHGQTTGDPDEKTIWTYQRKEDGTLTMLTTDIDLVSMEYTRRTEELRWAMDGRVMYEYLKNSADGGPPLTVFLLESVSKSDIRYRLAFADEKVADWPSDVDKAGPGKPIRFSEDYEEITDD